MYIASLVDHLKSCLTMELSLRIISWKKSVKNWVLYKIYSPPYRPQSNGRVQSFHYFLKACIAKHIAPQLEWDDIVPLACTAYNFLPNEHSRESPFFLMFGRDPLLPLTKLFKPKVRYLGNDENILSLEALKNMYQLVVTNLNYAREKRQPKVHIQPKLKEYWLKTILLRPFSLDLKETLG